MITILVDQDGTASHLSNQDTQAVGLDSIGTATTRRASHIEPTGAFLRFAFHGTRMMCGRFGEQFTRGWRCTWRVNLTLSGGPIYGSYADREQAIAEEERWLIGNQFGRPIQG